MPKPKSTALCERALSRVGGAPHCAGPQRAHGRPGPDAAGARWPDGSHTCFVGADLKTVVASAEFKKLLHSEFETIAKEKKFTGKYFPLS